MKNGLFCSGLIVVFMFAACVTAGGGRKPGDAASKTCMEVYEENNKSKSNFVGFGSSYTQDAAVETARADLTMQIRTKVEGRTAVMETEKDVSMSALSSSDFSEILVGLRVIKRCPVKDGKFQAVVALSRTMLLRNIAAGLKNQTDRARQLGRQIKGAKSEATRIRQLIAARKFLDSEQGKAVDSYNLCRTFSGCAMADVIAINELDETIVNNFKASHFKWQSADAISMRLQDELVRLLGQDGIVVTGGNTRRVATGKCWEKIFPQAPGITDRFVELNCRVSGLVNGTQVFTYNYTAKGVGPTPRDAANSAAMQLEKAE